MSRKVLLQLVLPLIGLCVLFWLLAFAPGEKRSQPPLLLGHAALLGRRQKPQLHIQVLGRLLHALAHKEGEQ